MAIKRQLRRHARSGRVHPFLAILLVATIFAGSAFLYAGYRVVRAGIVEVDVKDRDSHFSFWFPAALANIGLNVASWVVPDRAFGDEAEKLAKYRGLLERVASEIEASPSFPLLDVTNRDEKVMIEVCRGRFKLSVHSDDEDVLVAIPIETVRCAIALLPSQG